MTKEKLKKVDEHINLIKIGQDEWNRLRNLHLPDPISNPGFFDFKNMRFTCPLCNGKIITTIKKYGVFDYAHYACELCDYENVGLEC